MAIFRLEIRPRSRAKGGNAVAAAAYIARDRLRDEQLGRTFDYRKRGGLDHAEILVPQDGQGAPIAPTPDRSVLWNQAEQAEPRKNARVAREYQFQLPHELASNDRLALARRVAQAIANRYGAAVDLAVHQPRPDGDPRNFHAHALSTTREYRVEGFGRKTDIELNNSDRAAKGLPSSRVEYKQLRALVAGLTNEALRDRGLSVRVDHRSLAAQGIDRRPQTHLGPKVTAIMRSGGHSFVAERIRAEQAADRKAALEYEQMKQRGAEATGIEQQRRRALESWQSYRRTAHDTARHEEREPLDKEQEAQRKLEHDYER